MAKTLPFWQSKKMEDLSRREWESLCDGCGRCCLNKLEDEETKKITFTDVACKLLNTNSCRCLDYKNRQEEVPDCISITAGMMPDMNCLPPTCAYVLVYKGKDLYWWHHLVSGSRNTVFEAGISVSGRVISEEGLSPRQIAKRLVAWPKSRRTFKPGS